jgi:isocitrate dehydrogenase
VGTVGAGTTSLREAACDERTPKDLTVCRENIGGVTQKGTPLELATHVMQYSRKEMGDAHYPDIKQDYNHVDACTMWFVKQPEYYDVIVTENLFGDIITDLAAIIQGGLGIAAGGNINPEGVSMFEPMVGSAPKYTGKNVINPLATICAGRHDDGHPGRAEGGRGHRQGRARRPGVQADQEPGCRQDGHGYARGRRPHRQAGQ